MCSYLCITVRFLQPRAHGRNDSGEPEWPPSPLRMFQALIAAAAGRWNERRRIEYALPALRWLESQPPPIIVAAVGVASNTSCKFYVPDNTADLLVSAWKKSEITKQPVRTEKMVRPTHLAGDAIHYLYPLANGDGDHLGVVREAARSITHLGWGVDMAIGDASIVSADQKGALEGKRWQPVPAEGRPVRVPISGTLDDLAKRHEAFLKRLSGGIFQPVPPLRKFRISGYRCDDEPQQCPYRVFELRRTTGDFFRYPQSKLIHIAGMVRHLAIKTMNAAPPSGVDSEWVQTYIAGHAKERGSDHRQLSYLALPSIGHAHTDPGVRRVMIVAPVSDDKWLDYVARRLAGQALEPSRGDEFAVYDPPLLIPVRRDNVARFYTQPANTWASVTPLILPGHDDHKPEKTRKLIEKALAQSGIDHPCEFEWGAFSRFPKSLSAHKYDKHKKPAGYIRPDHLKSQTVVHLTLRYKDGLNVPGPIAIGAGRHCGFGLMAALDQ